MSVISHAMAFVLGAKISNSFGKSIAEAEGKFAGLASKLDSVGRGMTKNFTKDL